MPRSAARNWDIVEALLETTLASILAQTDPDISIIIAGHDRPARLPGDKRVRFIETPSPPRPPSAGNVDRGLKAFTIAHEVLASGGGFLALVDADDWVDRRFAETARAMLDAPEHIGGYLTAGYLVDIASLKLAEIPDPRLFDGAFVELCGSSIVARLRPEEKDPLRRNPHRVLHEHHRWRAVAASQPDAIIELPLRNAYAVNTSENHSEHLSAHALWRQELNAGVNRSGTPITPAIAADLGLTIERLSALSRVRRGGARGPDRHDREQRPVHPVNASRNAKKGCAMADAGLGCDRIRVGLIGVGNCASSFVQGLEYYGRPPGNAPLPGLISPDIGGYGPGSIDIVSAFDISAAKVGRDVSEAIGAQPNNTFQFANVGPTGVRVSRGPTFDGLGQYLKADIEESDAPACNVRDVLSETGTEVVVSYLPVGSQRATEYYAEEALAAGCAFVNCVPVFIASEPEWQARFAERGLPLIGDDVKSQVGATIVHRMLANLFRERGIQLDHTYQLNFGGNADFKNMLERERLESKRLSKTRSVNSQLDVPLAAGDIHIGPSDHVPWLTDRKWAYIRLEGTAFGGVPLNVEVKLEVWDSPNSSGVVVDAVRCAKLALDRGQGGALEGPSSYYMKSPPRQFADHDARVATAAFIAGTEPGSPA